MKMKRQQIMFISALLIILLAGSLVLFKVQNNINGDRRISNTTFLYEKLSSTRLSLKSAINSHRDYLITGNPIYLELYAKKKQEMLDQLNLLKETNKKNGFFSVDKLDSLEELLNTKLGSLDAMIGKKNAALDLNGLKGLLESDSTKILDDIQRISNIIQHQIEQENSDYRNDVKQNSNNILYILISSYVVAFILLIGGYLDLMREIQRRKRVEEELYKQTIVLEKNDITKNRFFSIIAHDLKSPFTGLIGMTDLLLEKVVEDKEDMEELLKLTKASTENTYKLLEELLEWARVQTGALKANPTDFNLSEIAWELADLLKPIADSKQIGIGVCRKTNAFVHADKNMVRTVLRNLVTNALKFSLPNTRMSINSKTYEDRVEVSVVDKGIGINQETLMKIFSIDEKVSRLGTANEKGTGLGLILCKELVELNGGKIWVESTVDMGSKFYFTLPLAKQKI